MKRLLIAAIMAIVIHGLVLGIEFNRIIGEYSEGSKASIITMTLVPWKPIKAEHIGRNIPDNKRESLELNTKIDQILPDAMEKTDDSTTNKDGVILEGKTFAYKKRTFTVTQDFKPVIASIPTYYKNPPPEYPLIARRKGFQGNVLLEVMVDRNGRAIELKVVKSSGYKVLDRAALASVRDWIFKPAIKGNEKIEMWVRVPICFQLK